MALARRRAGSIWSDSSKEVREEEMMTYMPLSNLPTPPLVHSHGSSRETSPEPLFSSDEWLDPELRGPALLLTNLIPTAASLTRPLSSLTQAILTRASLPLSTLALAVCILDSLNSRFSISWRHSFPLSSPSPRTPYPHIDSTHSEVVALSALILAVKFVDDLQESSCGYAQNWGHGLWTCEQINYTQRILLENLNYRLLPLWKDASINYAIKEMDRASRQVDKEVLKETPSTSVCLVDSEIWVGG